MFKPIPAWKRFNKTVTVQRGSETGHDYDTVIEALVCRIWPRSEQLENAGFGMVRTGTHRLACDWDHVHVKDDLAHTVQEGDKLVDDPSVYDGTGRETEYTVVAIENPAGIGYNAEMVLAIRGQGEVD